MWVPRQRRGEVICKFTNSSKYNLQTLNENCFLVSKFSMWRPAANRPNSTNNVLEKSATNFRLSSSSSSYSITNSIISPFNNRLEDMGLSKLILPLHRFENPFLNWNYESKLYLIWSQNKQNITKHGEDHKIRRRSQNKEMCVHRKKTFA